jgi:hypothetical protein
MNHLIQTHAEPVKIEPDGWYTDATARLLLDVPGATLAHARRTKSLRFTRRGIRIFYRGQWLIDWLESGTGKAVEYDR